MRQVAEQLGHAAGVLVFAPSSFPKSSPEVEGIAGGRHLDDGRRARWCERPVGRRGRQATGGDANASASGWASGDGRGGALSEPRPAGDGEVDFYLSNGAAETSLAEFAQVSKAAHRLEECLQRSKSEAGLADYEVRNGTG